MEEVPAWATTPDFSAVWKKPTPSLTVSEVERLAKAGVHIDLDKVIVIADMQVAQAPFHSTETIMEDAIWERWKRARRSKRNYAMDEGKMYPFRLLATQHGDKVWVSVHPTNFNYEPWQIQDDNAIFPSDALMANIALWEKMHP